MEKDFISFAKAYPIILKMIDEGDLRDLIWTSEGDKIAYYYDKYFGYFLDPKSSDASRNAAIVYHLRCLKELI